MTEVKAPVRVLQSGKVYRQMFDAEVQLMKSLDASKLRQSHTSMHKVKFPDIQKKTPDQSQSNLTNASLVTPPSMLSDRQKTWTEGMPNDAVTENPVLYRQLSTAAAQRLKASAVDKEVQEVHGLPNVVQIQKKGSNINERISEKRKVRHDKALEDMYNDLCMVSNRTEPRINGIGENLRSQLKEDDIIIDNIFKSILSDEELVNFSHDRLEELWIEIESHSMKRRAWVQNAHMWFNEVEDERLEAITAIFKSYSSKLEKIAYILSPDVHRLIVKEAMMINQSVLANRRAYAKLQTNLLEGDIEREVEQHRTWLERVKDWKKLNAEFAVKQFTNFMNSELICDPPEARLAMENFLIEQKNLSEKRQNILDQLKELMPPNASKPLVYNWNLALSKCHEDLDRLHTGIVKDLHHKYEATCQLCLTEIEKYKSNLTKSMVCDEEDTKRIVDEHFLPQVGNQLKIFEVKLEDMDKHLEDLAVKSEQHVKALFKAAQGAAHLWDLHQAGMAKQERLLQNELEQARELHDAENQEREMKLDVTLDRLRQESTEEALNVHLEQCSVMLRKIKQGYEEFHTNQLERVAKYPDMIGSELERYEENICDYFKVKRVAKRPSEDNTNEKLASSSSPAVMLGPTTVIQQGENRSQSLPTSLERLKKKNGKTLSKMVADSKSQSLTQSSVSLQAIREVFATKNGTEFYIFSSSVELTDGQKEVDGETNEQAETSVPDYIENVNLNLAQVKELKHCIRINFLNHLDEWKAKMVQVSQDKAKDKVEELTSELDLRLHLHEPRAKRIEIDVRNVRAAELVLHKERVNRHCKGITAALESLKQDFIQMSRSHDDEASAFRAIVEKADSGYVKATKSSKLKSLNSALHNEFANYVENVKTSLRDFRRILDTTLGKLRESNAQCTRSFKLFCEGGNFSPDETVPLRRKLEKVSQRVDNAEGAVMKDLEGMESKRIETATEIVNKVEDRYKNHLTDLTFIETLNRWATNAQVLIKSEAAFSNGMAAEVGSHLDTLRRRVDACEKPNIDKESVTPELLHTYALQIMESLCKRADYLNCKISENIAQKTGDSDQEMNLDLPRTAERASGSVQRKSVTQLASRQSVETQSASQGRARQFSDDAAIGLIKTILRGPREKTIPDVDDVRSVTTTRAPPSTANSTAAFQPRSKSLQRQNTTTSSTATPEPPASKRNNASDGVSVVYKRRDTKFEMKYMVFGAKSPEGEDFIVKTRRILYDALDGMLSTAEIYYKQKGIRNPARPQFIQETFDSCAEKVVEKLQKFETQTLDFHNNSLQDFRKLLHNLEYELCHVPRLVLGDLLKKQLKTLDKSQNELEKLFMKREKEWEITKRNNQENLRPVLGHPDQAEILQELSDKEKVRQTEQVDGISEHANAMRECVRVCASQFAEQLSAVSNELLTEFDGFISIDDVVIGRVPPHKELTSVLVRRRQDGYDISEVADPSFGVKPIIERGSKTWLASDFTKLEIDQAALSSQCTESTETSHTSLPQAKAAEYRDDILTKYEKAYHSAVRRIGNTEAKRCDGEERWKANWNESITHVQNLYKQ